MTDIETARLTDRLMRRIHAHLGARSAEFDQHKVGPSGGILLLTLADMAPVKLHELVAAMQRDKSQMTRAIQALERKGLVARAGDADDARVIVLSLTELGEATAVQLQQAVADALTDILSPLSADEQATLRALLARI
ncbi:MAG: MarR family transcriptional regulator [Devosiaceae bacterium]|nr:MarR family transcriptional regulator [Devosiaceae bacterium MH13]